MQRGPRVDDVDLWHEGPRREAGPGHPLPRRRQRRLDDYRAALSVQDWLRLRSELILKNEKRTEQAASCVGRYLPRSPSYAPMAGMKRISAGGRALLVAGALLVFYSLFYTPWFVVSGNRTDLPPGTYSGMGRTGLMNTLIGRPWACFAFVCLVLSPMIDM